ncbi:MAG: 50S ribosomal protein L24 [Thermoplasmata archaeon]|nr:50S ribosomal protein L24 [Thermoplasmata archaeon]
MSAPSRLPRKQRLARFTAHTTLRRRLMSVPLSRDLRARYGRRQMPVRKGDTVRVLRGSYIGREERVARVDRRSYSVTLDNITVKTGEAKLKPLPLRTNSLLLVRLNLADPWRRRVLRVAEGEPVEDEAGEETPTPTTPEPQSAPEPKEGAAAAPAKPKRAAKADPEAKS